MGYKVISCREKKFKDNNTGNVRLYYQVYIMDKQGGIGYINCSKPVPNGKEVKLDVLAGNDGRLRLVVAD